MSDYLNLLWENVEIHIGEFDHSTSMHIALGLVAICLVVVHLSRRRKRVSATPVAVRPSVQPEKPQLPSRLSESKLITDEVDMPTDLGEQKKEVENIKKLNSRCPFNKNNESLNKILESESFKSSFNSYGSNDMEHIRSAHANIKDTSSEARPTGCVFAQIMQEIEEKRRQERIKEGKPAEYDLFGSDTETDEKSQYLNAIDDVDTLDDLPELAGEKMETADRFVPIKPENEKTEAVEPETANKMPEPEPNNEEELNYQKKQLEKIFQLLKEQEMINQLESFYTEKSNQDEEGNLKLLQSNDDFKFSILNKDGESEYELRSVFESQMKLYGFLRILHEPVHS